MDATEKVFRTFIAIELAEEIREEISRVTEDLRKEGCDIRWVPLPNIHLTLKFLGNVESDRLGDVLEAVRVASAGVPPFNLRFAGLGAFPNLKRPKVLWVGVEEEEEILQNLQSRIEEELFQRGFPKEDRPFSPHLTIGRIRSGRGIQRLISAVEGIELAPQEMRVDEIVVMKSDLKPTGAVYSRLGGVELGNRVIGSVYPSDKKVVIQLAKEAKSEKERAIELAVTQIEKQYGKGSIMRLGEDKARVQVDTIPTGSLALDAALGIGGVPRGRVVELFGPEAAGKSLLALHIVAEAQKRGGMAAFVDAEHALYMDFARRVGVDVENLLISQPDSGEEALEITDTLVRSGAFDVIVIDSVAALVPRAELEGEMGEPQMGLQARLMSQALRKLAGSIHRSRTCVLFINQLRMRIGVVFGNPETTTGGRALSFYSSVRMDIRRIGSIKERDEVIGNRTRVKVVKNKLAPPFKEAEFDIMFAGEEVGISKEGDLLDIGVEKEIIEKSGTWFSYQGERLGQGRENAKVYLRENPSIAAEIDRKVRESLGVLPKEEAPPEEESAE